MFRVAEDVDPYKEICVPCMMKQNAPQLGVGARLRGRYLPQKRKEKAWYKINRSKVFEEREKLFSKSFSQIFFVNP